MNKIERMFLSRAIRRGGISLYSKTDTLDFIGECRKHNIKLLGLDGFFITDNMTQPSLEDSKDFSTEPQSKDIYTDALEFIINRKNNLYFEVVCG